MSTRQRPMQHARRVALLMEASRNYERGLLSGIARYAAFRGAWEFYRRIPHISGGDRLSADHLRHWNPDGIIVRECPELSELLSLGLPAVVFPSTSPVESASNVVVDDHAVGHMAAEYLIARGFRHFAYCGMDGLFFWSRNRRDGFVAALAGSGFSAATYTPPAPGKHIDWNRDLPALRSWLEALPTPVGIMVCNDDFSLVLTEACKAAHRRIPEDIALIGVGDDEAICDLARVPLTSIRLNTERGGYDAAQLLDDLMDRRRSNRHTVQIPPLHVVERRSTDTLDVADDLVAQAMRFIRDHARDPIHVDDVVRAVPLSRRALYTRFSSATGQSIYEYIRLTRLDLFARLLLETDLRVGEIALSMGFPDEKNVARAFRRFRGMTPLAYRRRLGPGAPPVHSTRR